MIVSGRLILEPAQEPPLGWIAIENGRIAEVSAGTAPERAELGGEDCLISPGFIDAHLHLPQFGWEGIDGLPLLKWLDQVIYPAEMRWAEEETALRDTARAYSRLLRAGTLGYAGFVTSHFTGIVVALRIGQQLPIRAIVGQAACDRNVPPELSGQELARMARSERGRTEVSANPRFAVACTETLMHDLARRAGRDHFIQTHLAESVEECERVRELFPDDANYTSVYDRMGLLGPKTLLAHCVHMSDDEWKLIAERRCVVVHCPTANTFLRSGSFDLATAREHGVRLALGSDIAAGPDVAMPRVARAMIDVAKMRSLQDHDAVIPTPAEVWQLITRGNALALGFDDAGELTVGAAADVLVIRPPFEIDRHVIGRLLHTWEDEYIVGRVLAGREQARRHEA